MSNEAKMSACFNTQGLSREMKNSSKYCFILMKKSFLKTGELRLCFVALPGENTSLQNKEHASCSWLMCVCVLQGFLSEGHCGRYVRQLFSSNIVDHCALSNTARGKNIWAP